MLKRISMCAVAVACIVAGTAKAATEVAERDANVRIERVRVDAFNEGVLDGACHNGQDGQGHLCR